MVAFIPPTRPQAMPHRHWGRYSSQVGVSVVRVNGVLQLLPSPSNDELTAAGREGTDWFLGGHEYDVSLSVHAELVAAGLALPIFEIGLQ